jgi:hypothetical protein
LAIPKSHPLYDHQDDHFARPADCPDPLCLRDLKDSTICFRCPLGRREPAIARPAPASPRREGRGGRRSGAGAPKGSLNHLTNGSRSATIRRAVDILAEHAELRPLFLMLARGAAEGQLSASIRKLLIQAARKEVIHGQTAQ